jgi:predicted Zn finger-like uncharacterized protein
MQFVCDSCKAMLQIADEKVRGKRLVVRCKKCGAKISISDPGLGAPVVRAVPKPEPLAAPAAGPRPVAVPAAVSSTVAAAPLPASRPTSAPFPASTLFAAESDSDTESTRAMDSDLLERALQASKRDDPPDAAASASRASAATSSPAAAASGVPSSGARSSSAPSSSALSSSSPFAAAPAGSPAARSVAEAARAGAAHDAAVWFAMLGGKQTGPLMRAEIALKVAQGAVGPRTYLWKEGMASWTRAKDVAEVEAMFAHEPGPEAAQARAAAPGPTAASPAARASGAAQSPSLVPAPAASPAASAATGRPEFSARDFAASEAASPSRDFAASEAESSARDFPASEAASPARDPRRAEREFSSRDFGSIDPAGDRETSAAAARGLGAPASGKTTASPASADSASPARPVATAAGSSGGVEPSSQRGSSASADSAQPAAKRAEGSTPGGTERSPGVLEDGAAKADERSHQDRVAAELFKPGEASSAVDLARWASSELGKQAPTNPGLAKVPPPADPFSQVPEAPALEEKPKADRTGEVLAFAGVQRSRTPLAIALVLCALLAGGALVWALSGSPAQPAKVESEPPRPEDAGTPQVAPAAGSDPAITALAARAAPAPDERASEKPVKKKSDALTSDQQADLKSLANERGVGTHGPGAAQAGETPDVEQADVGLTADDVRKKLGQSKGALQGCIDEALRREPNLRVGKIHIATTIAPSGAVTATRIDKQTVDQSLLGTCLKRATRRIVFPSFQGEAFEVDIPIVVTAGE